MLNIGSITKIEIAPSSDITLGTPNSSNEVTVTNAGSWTEPSFISESASFEESENITQAGLTYTSKLKWALPKVSPAAHQTAHQFSNVPVVIRITDGNGNKVVFGTPTRPVFIKNKKTIPEKASGLNAYNFEANYQSPHPAYFSE